jgi:signal transduction histidine kinase
MKKFIQILLVEDTVDDAVLIQHALAKDGLQFALERVETSEDFIRALDRGAWDIILSDYSLPAFDGCTALSLARKKCPEIPFLFVTGLMGEELAIETLKNGATDYVMKDRLARLPPAVQRALREARERSGRKNALEQLRLSHDQLRALSVYLQTVREEERIRISRAVHDELGQALTGLKIDLAWLGTRLVKPPRPARDKIAGMSSRIDETIATVRRIATELRPGILDHLGLAAAIEWQAREFQNRTGIECRIGCSLPHAMLDEEINTAFFRIFQETLTNVARHAEASRVEISLVQKDGHLTLRVGDNGRGITKEQIANIRSLGLLGMKERASLLGGFVAITGHPRTGTTVTVNIPLLNQTQLQHEAHENTHCRRSRRRPARLAANSRRRV